MAGLCGVIGPQNYDIRTFSEELRYHGTEEILTFQDDYVGVGHTEHPIVSENQPETSGNVSFWVWGVILGHEWKGAYTRLPDRTSNTEYCAELYEAYGIPFIAGLNSDFSGVILDKDDDTVSFFTDRLGSRPLYYTYADDGALIFSSQIQSIVTHPHVTVEFNPVFLSEFLQYGRCFGIYTPIKDVYMVPPASVITFDMKGYKVDTLTYWWPNPSPRELPFNSIADGFTQTFSEVVQDHLSPERDYGLLLSGGTDSRAVLAASEGDVIGLHMNEKMEQNKEECLARRAANLADVDFKFLERTSDYYPILLEQSRKISNYNGRFRHARITAFSKFIHEHVDVITSGHYGDTVVGGWHIPWDDSDGAMMSLSSPQEYANCFEGGEIGHSRIRGAPDYVTGLPEAKDVIQTYLQRNDKGTTFHGISYPSWNSFIQFGMLYPITNTYSFLFYESNYHVAPTQHPFHDNRIIDHVLTIPVEYRCQHDIIGESLQRLDEDLASIESEYKPSSLTELVEENIYLNHLFNASPRHLPGDFLKFIGILSGEISRRRTDPSYTYKSRGQRPSEDGSIRYHNFVDEKLNEHKKSINNCPFINYNEACECYRDHLDGANHSMELFSLLSLLETPAFEKAW